MKTMANDIYKIIKNKHGTLQGTIPALTEWVLCDKWICRALGVHKIISNWV